MKKLLVLALVLSMATMASATLQISVGGVQGATEATINPTTATISDIGIYTDAVIPYQVGVYYVLAIDTAVATIDNMSGVVVSTDSGMSILNGIAPVADAGWPIPVAGVDGIAGGAFNMDASGGIAALTDLFSSFSITGIAAGDTTLYLFSSADGGTTFTQDSSVVVHIVPEPITMTLLGLGGLFLRRRSK